MSDLLHGKGHKDRERHGEKEKAGAIWSERGHKYCSQVQICKMCAGDCLLRVTVVVLRNCAQVSPLRACGPQIRTVKRPYAPAALRFPEAANSASEGIDSGSVILRSGSINPLLNASTNISIAKSVLGRI